MKYLIVSSFFFVLANSVQAQSIVGNWFCVDQRDGGLMESSVEFTDNGKFNAEMDMTMQVGERSIEASAKYRSNYSVDGDQLDDNPTRVRITKFTVNGVDQRGSEPAKLLRKNLASDKGTKATIKFTTGGNLHLVTPSGTIRCSKI